MQMPAVEALPDDAVILSFHIPYTRPREYVQTYRVARRPADGAPDRQRGLPLPPGRPTAGWKPGEATIIYGGLASMTYRAGKTEQFLAGKPWNQETLRSALAVLKQEVRECTIPMDEEGISTDYRRQLAENFFYKFFLHVALAVNPEQVAPANVSAANHHDRPLSSGTQEYTEYPELFPLTKPIIKRAAFVQATGEVEVHAGPVAAGRRPARGDGQELAAARPLLLHQEGRRRWTHSRSCCGEQYPDFQAFVTVADIPEGRQQPHRPGRGRPRLQRRRGDLRGRPHRAGGRGDHRHGARGGRVHRAGVHRLRGPARPC